MTLRPARDEDRDAILAIRNDPSVVAQTRGALASAAWWQAVRPKLWVIEDENAVAGYVIAEPTTLFSIAVAPDKRGQGLGAHALSLCGGGIAFIHPENEASRMTFARAGFTQQSLIAVRK